MARILIIEDDGEMQQLLSLVFNKENYEVHYAFNGKEGYEKILALQPDVILLDLMLPILNGVEIIQLVSTNTLIRDIPIVVMTAHGDSADMLAASVKAQGVREYLRKPFEVDKLRSIVKRLLAQYPRKPAPLAQVAKGAVRLDKQFRTLWIGDRMVATLSPTKTALVSALLESKGPVKRDKLFKTVWGRGGQTAALEKMVQRLRQALGPEAHRLQTTGEGYELIG